MKFFASTLITGASLLLAPIANAQVIFDALNGDTVTTVSNSTNTPPTFALSGSTGTLTRTNGVALSHMVSNDNIQTLNGGIALTATDVVQVTWTVDSAVGYTASLANANAVEFGLATDAGFRGGTNLSTISRFRGDSNLINANRVGHAFENVFAFDTTTSATDGPGAPQTEDEETVEGGFTLEAPGSSFEDGFTVVQTISADGVTTQYSDIEAFDRFTSELIGTTLTVVLDPFAAEFDYVTFINGARFYAGTSISDPSGGVITFSTAQIELNPVISTPLLGDVNMDGTVNFLDITPFIALLASGEFQFEADIDGNGTVNFLDITPFIALLSS